MRLENVFVPYGAYWTTPFCRWQGSLATLHAIELAGQTARRALAARQIAPERLEGLIMGYTVMQRRSFYGTPWLAGLLGAPDITGPMVSQACATSARVVANAALEVETGQRGCVLGLACDRTSNGPHVYYPNPNGSGGTGESEDPVWDNFGFDPWAGKSMLQTAENVAREAHITREEQDAVTLQRFGQYQDSLANERAFQKRYMVAVDIPKGKGKTVTLETDEGVFATTADGLARLKPVLEGGTVTYGCQTFPADANAGIVICNREQARQLGRDSKVTIRVVSYGEARVKKAFMPTATVPAARQALERAGIDVKECKLVKTHNPFAVNDIYFCRETGFDNGRLNRYGSPLIYGHPQGPTGLRCMIELIEALVIEGGGYGLFTGCAAGDSSMAVLFKVE